MAPLVAPNGPPSSLGGDATSPRGAPPTTPSGASNNINLPPTWPDIHTARAKLGACPERRASFAQMGMQGDHGVHGDHQPHGLAHDDTYEYTHSPSPMQRSPHSSASSPKHPTLLASQIWRLETSMSTLVKDWHSAGQYGDMAEGILELDDGVLRTLGVPLDAASEIIGAHFKIMTPFLAHPDSSYPPGPYVAGIWKYMGWTHLHDLDMEGFIMFYSHLVVDCLSFHIALTPFHGVNLCYGHDGLCLPGLGT